MNDTTKHITIIITKQELDLIKDINDNPNSLFDFKQINDKKYILLFENIDKALKLDELIKDKLMYQGFDQNYNTNSFGLICESLIDKLYELLK